MFVSLLVLGIVLIAVPAYAYLDAGTGSFVLQIAIASLLGAGIALRVFWAKIKSLFSSKKDEREEN
jgi:hypothetical protein